MKRVPVTIVALQKQ